MNPKRKNGTLTCKISGRQGGEGTGRLLAEPLSGCYAETADRFRPQAEERWGGHVPSIIPPAVSSHIPAVL